MKGLTKAFRRLQNVTISNYNSHKKAVLAAYYWLKAAANLQKFRSVSGAFKFLSSEAKERNHKIFLKQLKRAKLLQRLEINFFVGFVLCRQLNHIRQICLVFAADYEENIKIWLPFRKSFEFAHKLEALEFHGPVFQASGFCTAFEAIPNPQNITSLALNTNPQHDPVCQQLSTTLSSFKSLTKLSLKLHQGIQNLKVILEAVQDCPLVNLDLHIQISKEEMDTVGSFLGKLSQLRTLRLVIETSLKENDEKYLIPLLGKIKNLVFLKSIEMKIIPKLVRGRILNGVVLSLGESLLEVKELERLKFDFVMGNYKDEVGCLMKSLQKRGKKMKALSLDLQQQKLSEENERELLKFLKGAEGMEELELCFLMIEEEEFGEMFKEEIIGMKRLKELRLEGINVLYWRDSYVDMIEKVIEKKGLEVYNGKWTDVSEYTEREGKIEMKEVMKRNRFLKEVLVPRSVKDEFKDFEMLSDNRWK